MIVFPVGSVEALNLNFHYSSASRGGKGKQNNGMMWGIYEIIDIWTAVVNESEEWGDMNSTYWPRSRCVAS